jgi:hypothetical protein
MLPEDERCFVIPVLEDGDVALTQSLAISSTWKKRTQTRRGRQSVTLSGLASGRSR